MFETEPLPSSESEKSVVPRVSRDNVLSSRYEFPASFDAQKSAMRSRLDATERVDREGSSYYELGGGLRTTNEALVAGDKLYDVVNIVDKADTRIIEAFEHFDTINLLRPGAFGQMDERDQRTTLLYFGRYMTDLQATIQAYRKKDTLTPRLYENRRVPQSVDRETYVERMELFVEVLREKHSYQQIRLQAWELYPHQRAHNMLGRLGVQKSFYIVHDTHHGKLHPNL